ncbi:voltage-dependent calcium channel type A subunit alpha-1-like [Centruroides sculpturatus]|uniref:voltage-dependent calcium channel type A subunit alpha-1-like n=1 Tax=Centruroides sculpturatus TaxID=218467 RepID=UPI000C6E4A10|nr:voltage-dependent calcium channel type A subunit alpha-1-like [Centruroides sculpturatus]
MIGSAGRHVRRRSSSPNPLSPSFRRASTATITSQLETEDVVYKDPNDPNLLTVPDIPPGVRLKRRSAVGQSDHKSCAILHSKLKGMKLEDVALSAVSLENIGTVEKTKERTPSISKYGHISNGKLPTTPYIEMAKKKQKGAQDDPVPSSLFIFGSNNIIRRCTRFLIEWPYPFISVCVYFVREFIIFIFFWWIMYWNNVSFYRIFFTI